VSPYLGVTIDQLIANKFGHDTILSSIQLGVEDTTNFGNCNWGYSCAYTNSISWTDARTPLPTEINPRVAFERLFGDGTNAQERMKGRKQNASILDSVANELAVFKKDLGAGDRNRLDDYTDNIRELERRITLAMNRNVKEPTSEIPFGVPESNNEHFKLMYDLWRWPSKATSHARRLSCSAGICRAPASRRADSPADGMAPLIHGDKPENIANYAKMNRYHVQHLANFLAKLKNMPEGDGTVLDHILVYKGSNMGNSHRHAHIKVPVILVGGIDGTFKGNRHLVFPDDTTQKTSNMLLSLLQLFGIQRDSIGQSSGLLPGLG
jgi:hypothetical protein